VGEIPLRKVKSSLRSGEIAAAVGGFYFTFCEAENFTEAIRLRFYLSCANISLQKSRSKVI